MSSAVAAVIKFKKVVKRYSQAPLYLADDIHLVAYSKVQDVSCARPPTDRALFHAHTTHLTTEALLLPGHVFGTACQYTCMMKTFHVTVLGKN